MTPTAEEAQQTAPQQTTEQERPAFRIEDMEVSDSDHRRAKEKIILRMEEFTYKQRLARLFANSGAFADIRGQSEAEAIAKAFIKIELGESMGFTPAESMTGIDIIQGRVAVGANLRAARMQAAGYGWPRMSLTDDGCTIPLEYKGKPMMAARLDESGREVLRDGQAVMEQVVVSFTKKDAERAGLLSKDNYKKNPRNMYFARAITNAQRWFAPSVLKADILASEEAEDLSYDTTPYTITPASQQAAAATEKKTDGLADKLAKQRAKGPSAPPVAESVAPKQETPAEKEPAVQAGQSVREDLF